MKKSRLLIVIFIFSLGSLLSASQNIKITFKLGNVSVFDGKRIAPAQLNQFLKENDLIRIPKGAAVTLTVGNQQIKIKGENKFKIKDLLENINQYEKFLIDSAKRKEISEKMIYRANPSPNLGVRANEEEENQGLNWSDDVKEKKNDPSKGIQTQLKENYLKGEHEGTFLFIKENPSKIHLIKKSEASFYVGASYYEFNAYDEAIQYFENYLDSTEKTMALERAALYLLAQSYYSINKWKKTIEVLNLFIKNHSSAAEPEVYILLAKAYYSLKDFKESDKIVKEIESKFTEKQLEGFREDLIDLKKK